MEFRLHSPYQPTGDQPDAISQLVTGVEEGMTHQVLLGATGTGKTFTIANVIQQTQKPTLVMAHNKTSGCPTLCRVQGILPGKCS